MPVAMRQDEPLRLLDIRLFSAAAVVLGPNDPARAIQQLSRYGSLSAPISAKIGSRIPKRRPQSITDSCRNMARCEAEVQGIYSHRDEETC
jgi:hypothetical protein